MESNSTATTDYLLNNEDRCDVCQAQAYVYVALESGELLFCLHHWSENETALQNIAVDVIDETEKLLVR